MCMTHQPLPCKSYLYWRLKSAPCDGAHMAPDCTDLIRFRKAAGMTQAELAERAGTTQATVSRIEQGKMQPTVDIWTNLVRACGLVCDVRPPESAAMHQLVAACATLTPDQLAALADIADGMTAVPPSLIAGIREIALQSRRMSRVG